MKRILSTLSVLLAVLSLAACGGGDASDDASRAVVPVNCQAAPDHCR